MIDILFVSRKRKILFFGSLCVFVICAIYLGIYTYNSSKALEHFDELEEYVSIQNMDDLDGKTPEEITEEVEPDYTKNEEGRLNCYVELSNRNSEMVGWLRIPKTGINYPVMQQEDNNSFYLNHNFDKKKQSGGLPMLDYQCDIDKPSDNLIIYGHNMRNGSVFNGLLNYKKEEFFRENKTIVLDSLYEHREYLVIAVFNTKVGSDKEFRYHDFVDTLSKEDFDRFISDVRERSIHKTDIDAQFGDSLITLSTCSYGTSNERLVVVAKRTI